MDDELPEECCAKCRFAAASEIDGAVTCRRFPPGPIAFLFDRENDFTVAAQKIECYFGVTDKTDWCGEFQPRKDAKPPRTNVTQAISDDTLIEYLDLPVRARKRLRLAVEKHGIASYHTATVGDVKKVHWRAVCELRDFGALTQRQVINFCHSHGINIPGMPSKDALS